MECQKCHSQNAPGSRFCNKCGTVLAPPPKPKAARQPRGRRARTPRQPKIPKQAQPGKQVKTQYSTLLIFLAIFVIVIAAGVIFLIPHGEGGNENYNAEILQGAPKVSGYGTLEIESYPEGAAVYLDNRLRGRTPFREDVEPGSYSVRLEHSDFQQSTLIVQIESGERVIKRMDLEPVYILDIPANPADALIKIDGAFQGKTPSTITWTSANCELVIERDGWSTFRKTLTLRPGTNNIDYALEKSSIRLTIKSAPSDAQVYIDDKLLGNTPLDEELSPGSYSLKVQKEGFRIEEKQIRLTSDLTQSFTLQASESITVKISVHPWAEVFIDGKSIGNVPPIKEISLTVGPHTFEFVKGDSQVIKKHEIKPVQNLHLHMNMESGELREIKGD